MNINIEKITLYFHIASNFLLPNECLKLLKINSYLRKNLKMNPSFDY